MSLRLISCSVLLMLTSCAEKYEASTVAFQLTAKQEARQKVILKDILDEPSKLEGHSVSEYSELFTLAERRVATTAGFINYFFLVYRIPPKKGEENDQTMLGGTLMIMTKDGQIVSSKIEYFGD